MKARKSSSYTRLFQRLGLRVMDTRFYKRAEWLLTPIKIYILQAGLRK